MFKIKFSFCHYYGGFLVGERLTMNHGTLQGLPQFHHSVASVDISHYNHALTAEHCRELVF